MSKADDMRRSELAAIHVAKKQLGLDDETYRAFLMATVGQYSAGMLTGPQRRRVLEELRRKGFRHVGPARAGKVAYLPDPQLRMVRGLWVELGKRGALRDRSESALNHFCKRVTYVDQVAWLDQMGASKLIEALKAWLERADKAPSPGAEAGACPLHQVGEDIQKGGSDGEKH